MKAIIASLILSHAIAMGLGFLIGRTERSEERARNALRARHLMGQYHAALSNVLTNRARLLERLGHGPELADWFKERDRLRVESTELMDRL